MIRPIDGIRRNTAVAAQLSAIVAANATPPFSNPDSGC
jgi:hypothetical protein